METDSLYVSTEHSQRSYHFTNSCPYPNNCLLKAVLAPHRNVMEIVKSTTRTGGEDLVSLSLSLKREGGFVLKLSKENLLKMANEIENRTHTASP